MRRLLVTLAALCFFSVIPSAGQGPAPGDGNTVVLDVSATEKAGAAVTDLRPEELQIQDDGKRVMIKDLTHVAAAGNGAADGRDLVLVLDDAGVPMAGTQAIQTIANLFMSNAGPGDTVSVLRLHNGMDEVSKDQQVGLARIAAFQAGSRPFVATETTEDYLRLVIKTSKGWAESKTARRRAIVCIGSPAVCVPDERDPTAPRDMYPNWVSAIADTARANVVVYAAIPGRYQMPGGTLVERSGGQVFAGLTNFVPAVETVYRDLSQYYLVSYSPEVSRKDIRPLTARTNRKDVSVNTRRNRGK